MAEIEGDVMIRKIMFKIHYIKSNNINKGSTMVEVLMGFVILSLMLGMLSGIISIASEMYDSSIDKRNAMNRLEEYVYKTEVMEGLRHENAGAGITLSPSMNMPLEAVNIDINADMYEIENEDISVYLVKER